MDLFDRLIKDTDSYIRTSADRAAKLHDKMGVDFEFFEGTTIALTSEMCYDIYRDLIKEIINQKITVASKYGLLVIVVPVSNPETKQVALNLQLGIIFPDSITAV